MKTIRQQIAAMHHRWPGFDLANETPLSAMWFGSLSGIERPYRVSVEFRLQGGIGFEALSARFPVVRVLSPRLQVRPHAIEEAPLPHVFFDHRDITLSPLCLFDPEKNEWSHSDLIARTTIPWAADWLACYEGWLATGRWFGGGRHAKNSSSEAS